MAKESSIEKPFFYEWVPGMQLDQGAVKRLIAAFHKPKEPMGEAWFMSEERKYFHELCGTDYTSSDVDSALFDITSGTQCFGELQQEVGSWRNWFHYLLATFIETAAETQISSYWIEASISAFMALYPEGVKEAPYEEFLQDIFKTMGIVLMQPHLWHGDEIVPDKSLLRFSKGKGLVGWNYCVSPDYCSIMMFCLKYLPVLSVEGWAISLLSMPSKFYRAQLLLWLLGMKTVFNGQITSPKMLDRYKDIELSWENSHCVGLLISDDNFPGHHAEFLPKENITAFIDVLKKYLTQQIVFDWLLGFDDVPSLKDELLNTSREKEFLNMFNAAGEFVLYDEATAK